MSEKGLEVLSPAGNLEIFKAVINAGADAVYFGGDKFGARAFAKNFSMEEGREAIEYAHLHGRKAYLTLNTLLKNQEMNRDLYEYMRCYYESGLDAVIVQDFGVFEFMKEYFPDLALHASTQMTITNQKGASYLNKLGASRIVTSREISLKEISDMYQRTHVEIETFVHGALCVSYSGQCLMSSLIGGRSGNRGRCAQPCRLPYEVIDDKGETVATKGPYVLSPKDLCGIYDIPALSESGVYSLKIEGRMKQLSYAAGVVSLYRKYVDLYLEKGKEGYCVLLEDDKRIFDLGNRCGFTNKYYYEQNGKDMITFTEPSHTKTEVDIPELLEPKIPLLGTLTAREGEPLIFTVQLVEGQQEEVCIRKGIISHAMKQPATEEMVLGKLNKTGGTAFVFSHLTVNLDDAVFLPVNQINEIRREALEEMKQMMLSLAQPMRQAVPFSAASMAKHVDIIHNEPGVLASVQTMEQFTACCQSDEVGEIAVELPLYFEHSKDIMEQITASKKLLDLTFPIIFRERARRDVDEHQKLIQDDRIHGIIIHSFDALGFLNELDYPREKICLNYRMYAYSNYTMDAFRKLGLKHFTLPVELNDKELSHLNHQGAALVVYGRVPVMVTANCIHKNCRSCDRASTKYQLKDRYGNLFAVRNHCRYCYNVIYNSAITKLFSNKKEIDDIMPGQLRLDFTLESARETKEVLDEFRKTLLDGACNGSNMAEGYTRGHFKRGVK